MLQSLEPSRLDICQHGITCTDIENPQCVCGNDRDAKLSVLDWDDNAHTIHTSSLHYFEGDPSLRMGRTVFPMGPKVVTDPQVSVTVLLRTTHRCVKSLTQSQCCCLCLL